MFTETDFTSGGRGYAKGSAVFFYFWTKVFSCTLIQFRCEEALLTSEAVTSEGFDIEYIISAETSQFFDVVGLTR